MTSLDCMVKAKILSCPCSLHTMTRLLLILLQKYGTQVCPWNAFSTIWYIYKLNSSHHRKTKHVFAQGLWPKLYYTTWHFPNNLRGQASPDHVPSSRTSHSTQHHIWTVLEAVVMFTISIHITGREIVPRFQGPSITALQGWARARCIMQPECLPFLHADVLINGIQANDIKKIKKTVKYKHWTLIFTVNVQHFTSLSRALTHSLFICISIYQ